MTTSMSQHRWSLPRPARVFALWATIVIHLFILGFMLQQVAPQVFPAVKSVSPEFVPLVDPPPPPPPRPEPPVEKLVEQPAAVTPVPVPPPPLPVPIVRFAPPPSEVASPVPVVNVVSVPDAPLIPAVSNVVGSGVDRGAELESGIDYQCRRAVRYPRRAERLGLHGDVLLRARIRPNGTLAALDVARSSGHRMLDRAAETWLNNCTFSAPALDAGSVERVGEVTVHFVLQ